jgi:hypothetical protein
MSALIDFGDCDWFAVDSTGQIALFTTAGTEYLPEFYWPTPKLVSELVEAAQRMPVTCSHEFIGEREAGCDYSSWRDAADRGLYGYDYDLDKQSGYKLITVPIQPLRVTDPTAPWAQRLPFFDGVFGKGAMVIPAPPVQKWMPKSL